MMRQMKSRSMSWPLVMFFLLLLSSLASAAYVDSLRELDLRLICIIVWFAPPIVVLFFVLGGILLSTGSPENRVLGKNLMLTAILGFLLVLAFLLIASLLVPGLDKGACMSGGRQAGVYIEAEGYSKSKTWDVAWMSVIRGAI